MVIEEEEGGTHGPCVRPYSREGSRSRLLRGPVLVLRNGNKC